MRQLSIIIPVYNVENYIKKCLHSIIDNNYLDDVEIICVDDGSQDDSGKTCDAFSQKYENVTVVHCPNGGVARARNIGLSAAHGKYIAWIDSDDYVEHTWLPTVLKLLREKSPDVLMFDYYREDNTNKTICRLPFLNGNVEPHECIFELSRDIAMHSYLWQCIIKHELYKDRYFDTENIIQEDYDMFTHLFVKINSIHYYKMPLYHYVQHETSLMHKKVSMERSIVEIRNAKKRCEIFSDYGFKISKSGYWRSLMGNYLLIACTRGRDNITNQIFSDIKKDFWLMIRSSDLTIRMKIKLILISYVPFSLYSIFYKSLKS